MRILLVVNKPNRDTPIMAGIKREILALEPTAQVEIWEMNRPGFNAGVLHYSPHVILLYPFTCVGQSTWYYIFKFFTRCKIFTLRGEGAIDPTSEFNIRWAIGFDDYGNRLVDGEMFWGSLMAGIVGRRLVEQGKLSAPERIHVVGYPRLETYFGPAAAEPPAPLPARIEDCLRRYPRQSTVLFITGFHLANYSRHELFSAGDLGAENNLDELLDAVALSQRFRQEWIDAITALSDRNPQLLLILKKHPIERAADYAALAGRENILFIEEDIDLSHLVARVGLFCHYGSTALVDAYLLQVPSVYLFSPLNKKWYPDLGWPSSQRAHIQDVQSVIGDYLAGRVSFTLTADMRRILADVFGIIEGQPFTPSRHAAKLILARDKPQSIGLMDRFFWRAVGRETKRYARHFAAQLIKRLLCQDPTQPLRWRAPRQT